MKPQDASEVCAWLSELFREIGEEQMAAMHKRFLIDAYRVEDVKEAAIELRPVVNFFDYERFNAIWNRVRQQNTDPKEKLAEAYQESEARREAERKHDERLKAMDAELQKLPDDEYLRLAQTVVAELPEDIRGLFERMMLAGTIRDARSIKQSIFELLREPQCTQ